MTFGTINSTGRITEAQAKQWSTYANAGWVSTKWNTNGDTTYPKLFLNGYELFSGTINSTGRITAIEAKQRATYESIYTAWDFTEIWKIKEGISYPNFESEQAPIIIQCQSIPFPLRMKQMTRALT